MIDPRSYAIFNVSLVSSLSYTGYITNLQSDQLPVVVIAQLVEHVTHIPQFMGANLIQA